VIGKGAQQAADQGFRRDIQGLRAIAVGAVVLYHAGVPFLPGGYVGVDVFFVISGFLITAHLIRGLERDDRVRFSSFYARRARRILPASFLVLIVSVIAALIWFPPVLLNEVWRGAAATALYVPNMLFAVDGTNYLAESTPSLFQHYWSLGIEEQFYLLWPLLLAVGWRWIRSRRALFVTLVVVVGVSFAACVFLTYRSQPWGFFSLPTRAWELGAGGVVAFLLARRARVLSPAGAAIVGWLGVGGIVTSAALFTSLTPFPGYWAAVPVASTAAVILAGATPSRFGPSALLSLRGMVFIGAISYSLYLVHWPALIIPWGATGFGAPLPLWVTLFIAAACVPVAWLIYKFVENPVRDARILVKARPRRSLLIALAGSATSVAVAAFALVAYNTAPMDAGRSAPAAALTAPPNVTTFVPANLTPSLTKVAEDAPSIYGNGCHVGVDARAAQECLIGDPSAPRIALFGDSHAAQWFPAVERFAADHGYSVQVFTKSACPAADVTVIRDGVTYDACDAWRQDVIATMNEDPPDMVAVSGFANVDFENGEATASDAWGRGLATTLSAIDAPTVVLADTPAMGSTPAICLSANLAQTEACAKPVIETIDAAIREAENNAATAEGALYVDLLDYFCTAECAPVIGDILVYRDDNHITSAFSAALSPALADALNQHL
jgi:peptidoglycan/LPS O-acetylase OafA/YrhL